MQRHFLAEIGSLSNFSGQKQVISKKKKIKGLRRLWVRSRIEKLHYSGTNDGMSFTTSAPKSLCGGGLFSIMEQKSASKTPKTGCFAYFSGQWGGARAWVGYAAG